jgi:hypothetical protein
MSRHWQEYGKKHKEKNRSRKKARRKMEKAGLASKGDGKDVHHKNGDATDNRRSNLAVTSRKKNRGHNRKRGG